MDSLRRGYPTNDAVLRQHAMMMAAGDENEWRLTGSDDDGPTVTFHGPGDIKDTSGVKASLTGNPYSAIQDMSPDYKANDRSAKINLGVIDRASGKRISDAVKDKAGEYIDRHDIQPWKFIKDDIKDSEDCFKSHFTRLNRGVELNKTLRQVTAGLDIAIAAVDSACEFLGWPNPIDNWIRKPLFGDWDQISESVQQWRALSQGLTVMSNTLTHCAQTAKDDAWQGEAGDAFATCCDTISQLFDDGVAPCNELAVALDGMIDLAKNALQLAIDTIDTIIALATGIMKLVADGAMVFTGVGAVKLLVDGLDLTMTVRKACDLKDRLTKAYQEVQNARHTFPACAASMTALSNKAQGIRSIAAA